MGAKFLKFIPSSLWLAFLLSLAACAGGQMPAGLDVPSGDTVTGGTPLEDGISPVEPPAYAVFSNHYEGFGQ